MERIFSISNWEVAMHEIHVTKISIIDEISKKKSPWGQGSFATIFINRTPINKCTILCPTRSFKLFAIKFVVRNKFSFLISKLNTSNSSNF
jgi:hypothetical protein